MEGSVAVSNFAVALPKNVYVKWFIIMNIVNPAFVFYFILLFATYLLLFLKNIFVTDFRERKGKG